MCRGHSIRIVWIGVFHKLCILHRRQPPNIISRVEYPGPLKVKHFSETNRASSRFPDGFDQTSGPIVILGFNKTGTTSLKHLFRDSGFREIKHDNGQLPLAMIKNASSRRKIFAGYDEDYSVFCDLGYFSQTLCFECNQLFRTIDHDYPNARFIYNHRPVDKWLDSRVNHRSASDEQHGTLLERSMAFHGVNDVESMREIWRTQRSRLEQDLESYFAGRNTLLKIDIGNEDVPAQISRFLAFKIEPETWKHRRKTTDVTAEQPG